MKEHSSAERFSVVAVNLCYEELQEKMVWKPGGGTFKKEGVDNGIRGQGEFRKDEDLGKVIAFDDEEIPSDALEQGTKREIRESQRH